MITNLNPATKSYPRGIGLKEAAAYAGMTTRTYRQLEGLGVLPGPIVRGTYDRLAIDAAFDARSGLSSGAPSSSNDAEAQLDRWLIKSGGHAR